MINARFVTLIGLLFASTLHPTQDTQPEWAEKDAHWLDFADAAVEGGFLQPFTSRWKLSRVSPDGQITFQGTVTDELTRAIVAGRGQLRRTQETFGPDGQLKMTQVHTVDGQDLTPIHQHVYTPAGRVTHLDFNGSAVSGAYFMTPTTEAMFVSEEAGAPGYDWTIFGLLLVGFPLDEGYRATFPTIEVEPGPAGLTVRSNTVSFEVTGREAHHPRSRQERHFLVGFVARSIRAVCAHSTPCGYLAGSSARRRTTFQGMFEVSCLTRN